MDKQKCLITSEYIVLTFQTYKQIYKQKSFILIIDVSLKINYQILIALLNSYQVQNKIKLNYKNS